MRPDDPRVPSLIEQFEHIGHDLFHTNPKLISAGIGYRCYSLGSGAAPAARHDPSQLCIYLSFLDGGATAKHGGKTIRVGKAFPGFPAELSVQYEYRYPAVYEPNGAAPPAGRSAGRASGKKSPGPGSEAVFRAVQKSVRFDPATLRAGMSVGSPDAYRPGTLGCVVYDGHGQPLGLSNWHILSSASGKAVRPSPYFAQARPRSALFGRVAASYPDIDCALATFETGSADASILGLGVAPTKGSSPAIGAKLVKSGSGSGLTFGRVVRQGLVKMNFGGMYDCVVVGCVEIDSDPDVYGGKVEICKPGDSGAVWMHYKVTDPRKFAQQIADLPAYLADPDAPNFDHTEKLGSFEAADVAALHFGEDNALMERALAVPIETVLHRLHVGLTPGWHGAASAPAPAAKKATR